MTDKTEIRIMGRYLDDEDEEIDCLETLDEATCLLSEYVLAFGACWALWIDHGDGRSVGQ